MKQDKSNNINDKIERKALERLFKKSTIMGDIFKPVHICVNCATGNSIDLD